MSKLNKYSFISLIVILFPFGLFSVTHLEIYPSLILPTGASQLDLVKGCFFVESYEILGVKSDTNKYEIIDGKKITGLAPEHFIIPLHKKHLGLQPDRNVDVKVRLLDIPLFSYNYNENNTQADLSELRQWIKKRLRKNGYNDDIIKFRVIEKKIKHGQREVISSRVVSEKSYDLD